MISNFIEIKIKIPKGIDFLNYLFYTLIGKALEVICKWLE